MSIFRKIYINKIRTQIVLSTVVIILISLITVYFLINLRIKEELQKQVESNAVELLASTQNIISSKYEDIILDDDELDDFKVIGEFVDVLEV